MYRIIVSRDTGFAGLLEKLGKSNEHGLILSERGDGDELRASALKVKSVSLSVNLMTNSFARGRAACPAPRDFSSEIQMDRVEGEVTRNKLNTY